MRNADYFKDKRVLIVGLARSGFACANLLYDLGAKVSVTDNQDNDSTRLNASKLESKDIRIELGRHSSEFVKDKDLVVVSPGVQDKASPILWANAFNIPIISEIEVGWILCPSTIIAVTGTNGKTTVTTLISEILKAAGRKAFILGNIGNPFCGDLPKMEPSDFVSLEVSSFQLERIEKFKPKIALILNFSENHLDRYKNTEEYLAAKKRIFMHQGKTDYLVLNGDDPVVRDLSKETTSSVIYFSKKLDLNPNQAAVVAVGSILGIDKELSLKVFSKFKGVQHRLEYVAELNNIDFINDSKSTNVDSTIWALNNIAQPVILIAGGKDKGSDYNLISGLIKRKVKEVILLGEAKAKIGGVFRDFVSVNEAPNLDEAVNIAFAKAIPGDCVLLSPMCSSFDMFTDFEERGRVFKEAVYDLIKDKRQHGT